MIIQQKASPDLTMPWPIEVDRKGFIRSGRPDAVRVIGFQAGEEQHIVLWTEDVKDPAQTIGLVPVFVANDGSGLFAVNLPVQRASD